MLLSHFKQNEQEEEDQDEQEEEEVDLTERQHLFPLPPVLRHRRPLFTLSFWKFCTSQISFRFSKLSGFDKICKFYSFDILFGNPLGMGWLAWDSASIRRIESAFFKRVRRSSGDRSSTCACPIFITKHTSSKVFWSHINRGILEISSIRTYLFLGNIAFGDVYFLRHPKEVVHPVVVHPEFSSIGASYNVWGVSWLKSQLSWQIQWATFSSSLTSIIDLSHPTPV